MINTRNYPRARGWLSYQPQYMDVRLSCQPLMTWLKGTADPSTALRSGRDDKGEGGAFSKDRLVAERAGGLQYSDGNYPGHAGWKEIVADAAGLISSSAPATDRSAGLTNYPTDLLNSPPQDLSAVIQFRYPVADTSVGRTISHSFNEVSSRLLFFCPLQCGVVDTLLLVLNQRNLMGGSPGSSKLMLECVVRLSGRNI